MLKAKGTDHPSLYHDEFYVNKPHWFNESLEKELQDDKIELNLLDSNIDFRSQQRLCESKIEFLKKIKMKNGEIKYLLKTKYPFRALTPGQVCQKLRVYFYFS